MLICPDCGHHRSLHHHGVCAHPEPCLCKVGRAVTPADEPGATGCAAVGALALLVTVLTCLASIWMGDARWILSGVIVAAGLTLIGAVFAGRNR